MLLVSVCIVMTTLLECTKRYSVFGLRIYLNIWMEKDQGVKVLVGKASGLVRKN